MQTMDEGILHDQEIQGMIIRRRSQGMYILDFHPQTDYLQEMQDVIWMKVHIDLTTGFLTNLQEEEHLQED